MLHAPVWALLSPAVATTIPVGGVLLSVNEVQQYAKATPSPPGYNHTPTNSELDSPALKPSLIGDINFRIIGSAPLVFPDEFLIPLFYKNK